MVSLSVSRRLMTSPTALPTINKPLTNSPQRIFFSAINACRKSASVCRAAVVAAGSGASASNGWGLAATGVVGRGGVVAAGSRRKGLSVTISASMGSGSPSRLGAGLDTTVDSGAEAAVCG
ncbi:MAG: hypothetical protein NTY19_29935 [Planctomycetota bacterium]|nr:hypothetical protein [Planctomycetota bacterium]